MHRAWTACAATHPFENALVWTGPKTNKERTKGNKSDLFSLAGTFTK